jgi:hypothetical protein
MNALIERSQRFLDRPLGLGPRLLLLAAGVFAFPTRAILFREGNPAEWVPFALGMLALLFLRAAAQGRVRDLVDMAALSFYFALFLLWTGSSSSHLDLLVVLALLVAAALVMAWSRASTEDAAEMRTAG